MSARRLLTVNRLAFSAGVLLFVSGATSGAAAQGATELANMQLETRADLQSKLRIADSLKHSATAALLRERLTNGDFRPGDRVYVAVLSPKMFETGPNLADTLIVQPGRLLQMLPPLKQIQLAGVLRSEVKQKILEHVAVYFKDPIIQVQALMRIQVLGHVANQRYGAFTPPDMLLSDVVTAAAPMSDPNSKKPPKIFIKRGEAVLWTAEEVTEAIRDGLSIDRLHLVAGDEIYVERPPQARPWLNYFQVGLGVIVSLVGIVQLTRNR